MITLDEQQDRALADIARIIRQFHGNAAADWYLRSSRRVAIWGLSAWRFVRPGHFENWNRKRKETA